MYATDSCDVRRMILPGVDVGVLIYVCWELGRGAKGVGRAFTFCMYLFPTGDYLQHLLRPVLHGRLPVLFIMVLLLHVHNSNTSNHDCYFRSSSPSL